MQFDADDLLRVAAEESGLSDFGSGAFDHEYHKFIASLNTAFSTPVRRRQCAGK